MGRGNKNKDNTRIKGRRDMIGRNMEHKMVDWCKCAHWGGGKTKDIPKKLLGGQEITLK